MCSQSRVKLHQQLHEKLTSAARQLRNQQQLELELKTEVHASTAAGIKQGSMLPAGYRVGVWLQSYVYQLFHVLSKALSTMLLLITDTSVRLS